eukprot:scaffold1151_cov126-Isochrysis_galbana.AAC.19
MALPQQSSSLGAHGPAAGRAGLPAAVATRQALRWLPSGAHRAAQLPLQTCRRVWPMLRLCAPPGRAPNSARIYVPQNSRRCL